MNSNSRCLQHCPSERMDRRFETSAAGSRISATASCEGPWMCSRTEALLPARAEGSKANGFVCQGRIRGASEVGLSWIRCGVFQMMRSLLNALGRSSRIVFPPLGGTIGVLLGYYRGTIGVLLGYYWGTIEGQPGSVLRALPLGSRTTRWWGVDAEPLTVHAQCMINDVPTAAKTMCMRQVRIPDPSRKTCRDRRWFPCRSLPGRGVASNRAISAIRETA